MIRSDEQQDRRDHYTESSMSMPRHLLLNCPVVDVAGLDFELLVEFWETIIEGVFHARIQCPMIFKPSDKLREDLQNKLVETLEYKSVIVLSVFDNFNHEIK